MKDAGLIFLWFSMIVLLLGFAWADGEMRQRIDLLNERLTNVEKSLERPARISYR